MMLGKQRSGRPSPASRKQLHNHMRRTTSMTEFAAPDVLVAEEEEDEELQLLPAHAEAGEAAAAAGQMLEAAADPYGWAVSVGGAASADWLAAYRGRARAAPGLHRNSADLSAAETAAFLRACGLCNRRLGPGRDTFMYRGETAFCSLECRQQHMTIEEWKDKCALATPPTATAPATDPVVVVVPLPPGGAAGSEKPGTLAAAS